MKLKQKSHVKKTLCKKNANQLCLKYTAKKKSISFVKKIPRLSRSRINSRKSRSKNEKVKKSIYFSHNKIHVLFLLVIVLSGFGIPSYDAATLSRYAECFNPGRFDTAV